MKKMCLNLVTDIINLAEKQFRRKPKADDRFEIRQSVGSVFKRVKAPFLRRPWDRDRVM